MVNVVSSPMADVGCNKCETWYHQKCEQLTNLKFNFLLKTTMAYICSSCCLNSHGNFNLLDGLRRLSSQRCTDDTSYLELIFMRHLPAKINTKPSLTGHFFRTSRRKISFVRNRIISRLTQQEMAITYVISLAINNTESYALELNSLVFFSTFRLGPGPLELEKLVTKLE